MSERDRGTNLPETPLAPAIRWGDGTSSAANIEGGHLSHSFLLIPLTSEQSEQYLQGVRDDAQELNPNRLAASLAESQRGRLKDQIADQSIDEFLDR